MEYGVRPFLKLMQSLDLFNYCTQACPNSRRLVLWFRVCDANRPLLRPKSLSRWAADRFTLRFVPPFVERFQQRDDLYRVGFYALAFLSFFGFHK